MEVKSVNSNLNFKAKFLYSDSLKQIVEYAVEHNKFDKLNQARKNIGKSDLRTRIMVDLFELNGKPVLQFSRYEPKRYFSAINNYNEYERTRMIDYNSPKKQNPLKFALDILIKMGNDVPNNRIFKNVVIKN